jgi:hypothetical protein
VFGRAGCDSRAVSSEAVIKAGRRKTASAVLDALIRSTWWARMTDAIDGGTP